MAALKISFFILVFFIQSPKHPKYLIVIGDLTCKSCVVQLHNFLSSKVKKSHLSIGFKNRNNFFSSESTMGYYHKELPKAKYLMLNNDSYFPAKERYPYVLKITGKDTIKTGYDSLFFGEYLNVKFFRAGK
jgi:hypothetical protein